MLLLGLDFETTGLNPETDQITEFGAVLWDTDTGQPVKLFMEYVSGPVISEEIAELTGLTTEFLQEHGNPLFTILPNFMNLAIAADFIVAHNAPFDRAFLEAAFDADGLSIPSLKWIDSKTDIKYNPERYGRGSLTNICANHGFLNPFPHRAVFDVLAMMKLVAMYPLEEILARSESPSLEVVALTSYAERELPKQAGFYWQPESKIWVRNIKECDLVDGMFPFKTQIKQ